jgi:sirohydrochlorin cobaltochelatase
MLPTATILFAHGSKDPNWSRPLNEIMREMRTLEPDRRVAIAYLELGTPNLQDAAAQMIVQGAQDIVILPVFLGVGKHLREDLPLLITAVREAHPNITIRTLPAIGEHPAFARWVAQLPLTDTPTEKVKMSL